MVKTAFYCVVIVVTLIVSAHSDHMSRVRRQSQSQQKKFYLENVTMANWHEALYHCRNHRGRLATVETAQENGDVLRLIRNAGSRLNLFWTSGTDEGHEGRWEWNTTGRAVQGYTAWQSGEPNNMAPGQHCMGYSQYTAVQTRGSRHRPGYWWVDADCDIRSAFICELDH